VNRTVLKSTFTPLERADSGGEPALELDRGDSRSIV
jgi:hypothetical protein